MKYDVSCQDFGKLLDETNNPREAYEIAQAVVTDGHNPVVTTNGLINPVRFKRANRQR